MIKVNLLGRKKRPVPFALDEHLSKVGINVNELSNMRESLIKLGVLLVGIYLANFIPNYFYEEKIQELNQKQQVLTQKTVALQKELQATRDIRKQMDQLTKEEVEIKKQLDTINNLTKNRDIAFKSLDHVIRMLPKKVWISKAAFKDKKMSVEGLCWEYFPINDFVKQINESTQYYNTVFKGIRASPVGEELVPGVPEAMQKIKNFGVEYAIKGSGEE